MFVVAVNFRLVPGTAQEFLPHIRENARRSVADEPGCRQFDVCTDPTDADHVFLYEIYDDRAAFDTHTTMPHFAAFNAAADHMIADKQITFLDLQAD